MKKLIAVFLLVFSMTTLADYSNGYRMGQITKFSIKGVFTKSGEGEMLVGSESTPLIIRSVDSDGNVTKKVINPWRFSSTNSSIQKRITSKVGDYVVIKYKQSHMRNPLATDTDYEVVSVEPITKARSKSCTATAYKKGINSVGIRAGRIVKASTKGTFNNSYEVTMQQGNSGNQFHSMSISKDKALYKCAIEFLKAGQKVKVHYSESIFNLSLSRDTTYDIVKIEVVKGLN